MIIGEDRSKHSKQDSYLEERERNQEEIRNKIKADHPK
jgi:hypothetical protein